MASKASLAQQVCDTTYYLVYGYALNASPENLKWALQKSDSEMLKYTFTEGNTVYSILEYAVLKEECDAVRRIKKAAGSFETLGQDRILHFYMESLKENVAPHLALLDLLIDNIPNINQIDSTYQRTPLEHALATMAHFEKIHWNVIENLFKRGAQLENATTKTTPFTFLKNLSCKNTFEEEKNDLKQLTEYLKIEKKYFPQSQSALSLSEFKSKTAHYLASLKKRASELDASSYQSQSIATLTEEINNLDLSCDYTSSSSSLRVEPKTVPLISNTQNKNEDERLQQLINELIEYKEHFDALVTGGNFVDCFDGSIVKIFGTAYSRNQSFIARTSILLLKTWGFLD